MSKQIQIISELYLTISMFQLLLSSSLFSVVVTSGFWAPGDYEYQRIDDKDQARISLHDWIPENDPNGMEVPGDYGYLGVHNGREHAKSFMNEWTVEVDGTAEVAQLVALELGYLYGGPATAMLTVVSASFVPGEQKALGECFQLIAEIHPSRVVGFPNVYRFLKYEHEKQRRTPSAHTYTLIKDRRVRWAEQLFAKSRVKRSPMPEPELHRVKRLEERENVIFGERNFMKNPLFNDELWGHQWYLQDTRTVRNLPRLDLNVLSVYQLGFNGSGVKISVLDDGIEHNHTDLKANYDAEISWDCNDGDSDPTPRYAKIMTNSHGTRCAGEIAMTANNVKCGVGVAWGAKVGGVRMLDGRITDRVEGAAIAYAADKVDIYSASWGPNDDGRTVEGPGRLALEAFKKGVTTGRGGKGAIYVWANGNGGGHEDNCNCDGYSSSIYTVSIGSASQHGKFPWYGEICSSTLAVAYSSGAYKDQKIATTDTGDSCTLQHTGTSAAAPLAAGILALALQANPHLTWRDVQHLIVWTSDYRPLSANPGWQLNGIGLHFDIRFGFGLLNAGSLVAAALNWTTVPSKHTCRFESLPTENLRISSKDSVDVQIAVDGCAVNFIEHVEAIVNVRHSRRGALEVYLTSPQETRVQLLSGRPNDTSKAGFVNWPLMSVATWGENPRGIWTLTVEDMTDEENTGNVGPISLILHGTAEMPVHMQGGLNWSTEPTTWIQSEEYDEVDPLLLTEVESELQRMNHRNNDFSFFGI